MRIIRRDDVIIKTEIKDLDGNPINLTGAVVFLTAKKNKQAPDADAVIRKEVSAHTAPTLGQTEFTLTAEDTDITSGSYFYDIQVVQSNTTRTAEIGVLRVVQDITIRTEVI